MTYEELAAEYRKLGIANAELKATLRSVRTCPDDDPNPCGMCKKIDEALKE